MSDFKEVTKIDFSRDSTLPGKLHQILFEESGDGILVADSRGLLISVNPQAARMTGWSSEELLGMAMPELIPAEDIARDPSRMEEDQAGRLLVKERRIRRKDGSLFPAEVRTCLLPEGHLVGILRERTEGKRLAQAVLHRDQPLQVLARVARQINEVLEIPVVLRRLVSAAMELTGAAGGAAGLLAEGRMVFTEYNREGALLPIDYKFDAGSGVPGWVMKTGIPYLADEAEHDPHVVPEIQRSLGFRTLVSVPILSRSEELLGCFELHNKVAGQPFNQQDVELLQALAASAAIALENARMLMERKAAQRRQHLAAEILGILNEARDLPDVIQHILAAIKRETGFDAIGIRLREQDDFPYFVQDGFSQDFLLTENSLAVRSKDGGICREPDGKLSLQCTCGLVLAGRTDPANPFFTPGGSFWGNDVSPLLHLPREQDPRLNPRNRCIHEGYQSVALIPLRMNQEVVGLLQFNDRRQGCFTPEMIQFFEGISASIGAALMHKQAEARQRLDESRLETLVNLSQMTGTSLETIASFALEEAVRLTQSEMGYIAFANEEETVLTMHAWSSTAMKQCRTKDKPLKYVVAETGLWGEPVRQRRAVITNDFSAPNPLKKGTPEGHVSVQRHLGVPIFDEKRIVIVAGVGNKATEYAEGDIRQLTLLMGGMWQILQRQRAEQEQRVLEAQLLQAQKMESIGRLAGGVAHDFNNMLAVILGHVELALEQVDPANPQHSDLQEIQKAAQRSADLTRQLLGFARKQAVAPVILNLNETLAGLFKMLRRLLGEEINLAWLPGADLWLTKMDPAQIDQVLTNLIINARDAISGVGMITIDTANITLDEGFCGIHPGYVIGEYVQLAVSDNGCGMKKEVTDHLFEPFFTTKGVGQGTGLGLATVYGIVKQNEGFINVHSEPGRGTSFKIYLPRVRGESVSPHADPRDESSRSHGETVLLVEDETAILNLGKTLLERLGYVVLAAGTPGEALRLAQAHSGKIHLLVTDVVMPEMNGHDLAQLLTQSHPELKCLFISGYTADVIAHRGILHEGVHFLQKPFSNKDLASKVQVALSRV